MKKDMYRFLMAIFAFGTLLIALLTFIFRFS